jgi:hypothetical protein
MGRYNASYEGIGQMLRSKEMQAAMHALAEKVMVRAQAIAPFDPDDPDGMHYRDAFEVSSGVREPTGTQTARAYGRVTNADSAAIFVEFGTKNNPKHRTLGRALDALKE